MGTESPVTPHVGLYAEITQTSSIPTPKTAPTSIHSTSFLEQKAVILHVTPISKLQVSVRRCAEAYWPISIHNMLCAPLKQPMQDQTQVGAFCEVAVAKVFIFFVFV